MLTWLSRYVAYPLWEIDNRTRVLPALRALERSQWLPAPVIARRQWERLQAIVKDAYASCDYYRRTYDAHGIAPTDVSSPNDFRRLPVLTKQDIRRHGDALIHRGFDRASLIRSKTGGSTGTSLTIYADRRCRDLRNAAAIRSDRWAGWDLGVKRAALWGNPVVADTLPRRIRAALRDRTVCLDTMNMSDQTMREFVALWRRYRPEILFGHAHSLYIWAAWLRRNGIDDLRPRGVISTSMMLLPSERAVIERVLGCRVTDRYGCEEVGLIASECERHRGLHVNADHVYVEFLREDGTPAASGEPAALVVTDLVNRGQPLVRYRIEDMAVRTEKGCTCGRGLPLIESVVGRLADFLVKPDHSLVAGVSLVERTLTAFAGIEQMQIVQEAVDDLVLHVVPADSYAPETERDLVEELRRVFGALVRVRVNRVSRIPQQASGKYRFAICNVPRVCPQP